MGYQVLARKWRPTRFCEVVGQSHVVKTLKNAIVLNRTAHAYLFVGPRGIGKTSIARIFAKALNCENPVEGEPCCKCKQCESLSEGNNFDVIEIDAASNNSVNDIKPLRDAALQIPVAARYKIFIIDEVHMLSTAAWNALLKLIEEPPSHVKFLFATTEVHKVLPTIISRCQRFDLHRIPQKLIVKQLEKIAKSENVKINKLALEAIARVADGGMRDAQSIFDQVISCFAGEDNNEIGEEDIAGLFGLTGKSELETIVTALINNDKVGLIGGIHALAEKGKDLEKLLVDILEFLRGIEITLLLDNPDNVLEVGEDTIAIYKKCIKNRSIKIDTLQRLLETLSASAIYLSDALNKRVYLETLLLKAMRIAHAVRLEEVLCRLNELRKYGKLDFLEKFPSENKNSAADITNVNSDEEIQKSQGVTCNTQNAKEEKKIPDASKSNVSNIKKIENKFSPEALWHELIVRFENANLNPAVKNYLLEANPEKIEGNTISISFDREYERSHFQAIKQHSDIINKLLREITGIKDFCADIIYKPEILSHSKENLMSDSNKDLAEARRKIEQNPFVQKVCDLFSGTIVDIHV